jgi:phosphonate transport system substrate-binding protein
MSLKKESRVIACIISVFMLSMTLFMGCARQKTITMAWLPNNSGDNEKAMRAEFGKIIMNATGYKVVDKLTTDYNIAMAALESGDAQLGYFGPFEYITGHARNSNIVALIVESGNSGTLSDARYFSRLLVKKGKYMSGKTYSINNIAGKKISFVSTSSTSGFNMPAAAILEDFHKMTKWKDLTKDDLMQGGKGKFFSQVVFSGSHQMSLANLLKGTVDISAVDDIDVRNYLELTSGTDEEPGAVYTVKKDAAAPFAELAGAQFVIIKTIPVMNTPVEANVSVLDQKTVDQIVNALTGEKVKDDQLLFRPKGSSMAGLFMEPHCFVRVSDYDYDGMRRILGLK